MRLWVAWMRRLPLLYAERVGSSAIGVAVAAPLSVADAATVRVADAAPLSIAHTSTISSAVATTVLGADAATISSADTATIGAAVAPTCSPADSAPVCVPTAASHASTAACDSAGGRGLLVGLRQQRWRVPWVLRRVWRVLPGHVPAWARRVRLWHAGM